MRKIQKVIYYPLPKDKRAVSSKSPSPILPTTLVDSSQGYYLSAITFVHIRVAETLNLIFIAVKFSVTSVTVNLVIYS